MLRDIKRISSSIYYKLKRDKWSFYRIYIFLYSVIKQGRIKYAFFKVFTAISHRFFGGRSLDDWRYKKWLKNNTPTEQELNGYREKVGGFEYQPLISIVVPVYKPQLAHLKAAIDSVKAQIYPHWELCFADDNSQDAQITEYLKSEAASNTNIKVVFREENGHISACSNSALALAGGEFIANMDQDDLLTEDALYHVIEALNMDQSIDLIYTDEDKINEKDWLVQPHFKPDWSPDNLLNRNYMGHLIVARRSVVEEVGGFRLGYEGSQDFDLLLRITDATQKVHHIPRVLYHWRIHEASTASQATAKNYAYDSGVKAINDSFKRKNIDATAEIAEDHLGFYHLKYKLDQHPKISIIIPTKDNAEILTTCLNSIFQITEYPDFEVILLNNNSTEESLFNLIKEWETKEPQRFKALKLDYAFNFAQLMNDGVKEAEGDYVVLLNNDTEVTQAHWLSTMLGYAQKENIGAVGVKLLYPNQLVQHAGIILGLRGIASHVFTGSHRDEIGYFCYLKVPSNFSAVTAACLMVSKAKFNEVGGFDTALAVDYNDIDFCLSLLDKGYYNLFVPYVELIHYESFTRGHPYSNKASHKRIEGEIAHFKGKWQKYIDHDPHYNPHLSRTLTNFEIETEKR